MNDEQFIKITQSLMDFCRERMGYEKDPDVRYLRDEQNSNALLGQTANYNPSSRTVSVYVTNRHPKDILRSLAHELVHHAQCCRGDLENRATPAGYAQSDPHMRSMEKEAYLKGNMMFRDWEDNHKQNSKVTIKLIGENKMTELKERIKQRVLEILKEKKKPKKGKKEAEKKIDEIGAVHSGKPGATDINYDSAKYKERFGGSGMHRGPGKARPKGMIDTDLARAKDADYQKTKSYCEAEGKDEFGGDVQRCMDEMLYDNPPRLEEGKCPHCDGDAPKSECNCKKESKSELTTIKKNQSSISSLNENRLLNLNKRLMERLIK